MVHTPDFPKQFLGSDLTLAYVLWETRKILSEDLIGVAEAALAEGAFSPSLAKLAGLPRSQATAAAPWLLQSALDELGLDRLDERTARLRLAQFHARRMLAEEIVPYDGARYIWRALLPDYPMAAMPFLCAEDEYERGWGRKDEEIDSCVFDAARELLRIEEW